MFLQLRKNNLSTHKCVNWKKVQNLNKRTELRKAVFPNSLLTKLHLVSTKLCPEMLSKGGFIFKPKVISFFNVCKEYLLNILLGVSRLKKLKIFF